MKHNESTQQTKCVKWFRTYYPDYVLFAVPNGGNRSAITGAILKAEGVMPGVADLFLAHASCGLHGLFIEMKDTKGRQSDSQKAFEEKALAAGYGYVVCRSFEEFQDEIQQYI